MRLRVGIIGYGKLGKAMEKIIEKDGEVELVGIFSRRGKIADMGGSGIKYIGELEKYKGRIDCLLLCIGSKGDSITLAPTLVRDFNTVDCFDTHALRDKYLSLMDESAKAGGNTAICMCGWDPGLFSLFRALLSAVFEGGGVHTFWGRGVSQGHSEAIRKIEGVERAICYTVPDLNAKMLAKTGVNFDSARSHSRECYVVANSHREEIEREILNMPHYFAETPTRVTFISEKTFENEHKSLAHRGEIIASLSGGESCEIKLELPSNPHFTARVMLAYAKAVFSSPKKHPSGALTPLDIPLSVFDTEGECI